MKIDAKKFLALTQLMAMPLVSATAGCIINTDDEGSTGNDSVGEGDTTGGGSNATTTTTGASASGGSGDGSTGADASAGTGGTGGTAAEETGATGGTAAEAGTGADETAGDPMGCCTVHAEPGCSDTTVQDCVCAMDELCCDAVEGTWDQICVDLVTSSGCGTCP
jgi:hypothetical protein